MITLYDCATAPSPRRARILLAEKRVLHATVQVDLHKGMRSSQGVRSFVVKVDLRRLGGDVESAYERFMGDNVRTLRPVKEAS